MPTVKNTFGDAKQQFPIYDAREVREGRSRFRRDVLPLLDRVNSVYCPSGRWPSIGWILMRRADYDQLDRMSTHLILNINGSDTVPVLTLNNWSIIHARCATRGLPTDPDALYLVEIVDARGVLHNEWFQWPITSLYNIRAPAYPQQFYSATLGTWTWATMLQNMWDQMNATGLLGAWPGLPKTPVGTPEGYHFPGVCSWYAFNDVLEHLGMNVACDMRGPPFTIVVPGAADTTFTDLQKKYTTHKEDDLEWIDEGAARFPATCRVYFRKRYAIYGNEETVRLDPPYQWVTTSNAGPIYIVELPVPGVPANAKGTHFIWDDFTVRYDQDAAPVAADVTLAANIAADRVSEYADRLIRAKFMTQTYAGAIPFYSGSLCDGVCWYMDQYPFQASAPPRLDRPPPSAVGTLGDGWRTQIVRGAYPPWPGYAGNMWLWR